MNPQYALDGAFLSCVTRHMDEHAPFGDIPRKVAASVRRAVVAVRAVARALHSAADIADEMRKVSRSGRGWNGVDGDPAGKLCRFMYLVIHGASPRLYSRLLGY